MSGGQIDVDALMKAMGNMQKPRKEYKERYIIDSSLDVISEELDPDNFFRISRSCIISLHAIKSIVKQTGRLRIMATPEPSFEMMVSRSRVDDFLEWLER